METVTIPIDGYRFYCLYNERFGKEFSGDQFGAAEEYLYELRKKHPKIIFEMVAIIAA